MYSSCARARAFRWTAWCWRAASAVNEAALTGESIPVDKARGRSGFGGDGQSVRISADAEATRVGEDTTLSQIIQHGQRRGGDQGADRQDRGQGFRRVRPGGDGDCGGDDRRSGCCWAGALALRWRAAFPCWSSAARARWDWRRRWRSWSAAAWARRTASCSKPPRRLRRPDESTSSRSTKPAPSPRANRR